MLMVSLSLMGIHVAISEHTLLDSLMMTTMVEMGPTIVPVPSTQVELHLILLDRTTTASLESLVGGKTTIELL